MSSKEKLLASAQKFLEKGQIAKAIKDYEQIVQIDSRDMRHRQKLAELYCRQNMNKEGFASFQIVARAYADTGFYLKAIAVYKQMLKLDPEQLDLYERLGELNEKQGLTGNALAEYRSLALLLEKAKRFGDAAAILQKMKKLEPENVSIRIKIIGLLAKEELAAKARQEFTELLDLLAEKQDIAGLVQLHEQLPPFFHQESGFGKDLAKTLLRLGAAAPGVKILRGLLKLDSNDPEILEALADGYRSTGDFEQERSTCGHLLKVFPAATNFKERYLRACLDANDYSRANESFSAWKGELERDCQPEALESIRVRLAADPKRSSPAASRSEVKTPALTSIGSKAPPPSKPPSLDIPAEEVVEELEILDELEEIDDCDMSAADEDFDAEEIPLEFLESIKPASVVQTARQETPPAGLPPTVTDEPEVALALGEEDLELGVALGDDLSDLAAHTEDDLSLDLNEFESGETDFFDDVNPPLMNLPSETGMDLAPQELSGSLKLPDVEDEFEIDFDLPPELDIDLDLEADPDALSTLQASDDAEAISAELPPEEAEAEEIDAEFEFGLDMEDDVTSLELLPEEEDAHTEFDLDVEDEDAAPLAPVTLELEDTVEIGSESTGAETLFPPTDTPQSLLDEAEFFLREEMFDEAEQICLRLMQLSPGYQPALQMFVAIAQARQMALATASAPIVPAVATESESDFAPDPDGFAVAPGILESLSAEPDAVKEFEDFSVEILSEVPGDELSAPIDSSIELQQAESASALAELASELDFVLNSDLPGIVKIKEEKRAFSETPQKSLDVPPSEGIDLLFEVDTEDSPISQEDGESHFSLGIAYKEMGLLDDAVAEFDKALRYPARFVDALSLKGMCLVETGAMAKAEEAFQKGLLHPSLTIEGKVCLNYELGLLYDGWERPSEALDAFQKVAESDQFFRDVQGKLTTLRQILGISDSTPKKAGRDRVSFV